MIIILFGQTQDGVFRKACRLFESRSRVWQYRVGTCEDILLEHDSRDSPAFVK